MHNIVARIRPIEYILERSDGRTFRVRLEKKVFIKENIGKTIIVTKFENKEGFKEEEHERYSVLTAYGKMIFYEDWLILNVDIEVII